MIELAKAMKDEIQELANKLGVFIKDFEKNYEEKVKSLEATAQHYSDIIIAAKEDIEKLDKEKDNIISEGVKAEEELKKNLAQQKIDFDRVIEGEQKRLQALEDKFEAEKKDYTETAKETTRLNQEAKQKQAEIDKLHSETKELRNELAKQTKEYDELISQTGQLKAQQDNAQKGIIKNEAQIEENLKDIDLRYKELVEKSNALIAKEEEQKKEDSRLKDKTKELDAQEKANIKESERLIAEAKKIEEQNSILTTQRSDLKSKEDNLRILEAELQKK